METILFILFASTVGLCMLIYFYLPRGSSALNFSHAAVAQLPNVLVSQITPLPIPSPTPTLPKITQSSWLASNGEEKITMKAIQNRDGTNTYIFILTNTSTNTDSSLFTQTVATASSMAIPFNAFSTDNSYVYLQQNDVNRIHYLVFKTSHDPINSQPYIDVGELFSAFTSAYTLTGVTGWTSESLLIVNAKSSDGSKNVTFWLDMSTLHFISLATFFP